MKRIVIILLCISLLALLTSCHKKEHEYHEGVEHDGIDVYYLIEEIRAIINDYELSHNNSIFKDKAMICFYYLDRGVVSDYAETIAIKYNHSFDKSEQYDAFYRISLYDYSAWKCIMGKDDIVEIEMRECSVEEVLSVVDSLPNLKTVIVDSSIFTQISDLRPDIEFKF